MAIENGRGWFEEEGHGIQRGEEEKTGRGEGETEKEKIRAQGEKESRIWDFPPEIERKISN